MFKRILFPTDFSDRSKRAAEFVRSYALAFGAEVTILHVVDLPDYLFGVPEYAVVPPGEILDAQRTKARKTLEEFLADEFEGITVHRVLAEGPPSREIIELSKQLGSDLIMMPTHGLGTFRRFVIGSTAAKVLHDAACAVWTDAHLEDPQPLGTDATAIRSIVCAPDLGDHSRELLEQVRDIATRTGADVSIAHAIPMIEVRPASYFDFDFNAHLAQEARDRLDKLQEETGTRFRICIHGGEPADVLRQAALQHNADLMLIGRGHVKEGFGRLRNHSYSIINKSPCPVLSV